MVYKALLETLYMLVVSIAVASLLGIPAGVLLVITADGGIAENRTINIILSFIVNTGRSIPFIILMVSIISFTRLLVGTAIGTTAAIVPLSVSAIPFIARVVETALREVDSGVVEAAQAMGASNWQIITKVLVMEALPSVISGLTITAINLVGYSAMAGAIGGGGLGDLAIRYGYQRFDTGIMVLIVIILVIMVQAIQAVGNFLTRLTSH
jgi:D-methionine transport system permease protein